MDLHRHDEFSAFDGFAKANVLAQIAKDLGHESLGLSNHGNTTGLVQHYYGCLAHDIKPVMGVEGYFLPVHKEKNRGYHLCLFAKNLQGYHNLNRIQSEGDKIRYYNPIWTFDILEDYSEGVICTSACVAGFLPQALLNGNKKVAGKFIEKMIDIFEDDFYIEIQPYKISDPGVQEKLNVKLIKIAKEYGVKCILTSDSHMGAKEDLSTYLKMHEIAKHDLDDIENTYGERYMPSDRELKARFYQMHKKDFGDDVAKKMANKMIKNLKELENKVEEKILDELPLELPTFSKDSGKLIRKKIKAGLKERGKYTKEYIERIKEEIEVIESLGFEDYFLIVADYVQWAKQEDIVVGPGRGSCCNCLVAYALGITDVDSLKFDLDFGRFLRKDKKKLPDIDIDFEKDRRKEVIEYLMNKYPGHTARIVSYGLYKVDNLINDLVKVCDVDEKEEILEVKTHIKSFVDDESGDLSEDFLTDKKTIRLNDLYDDICIHFSKLYRQCRFIGTHSAGVAVTGGDLLKYTSVRLGKDNELHTAYDLNDLENINVIKFDMLGLRTMGSIGELRKLTGTDGFNESMTEDEKVIEAFNQGNTSGIFQFDKVQAQSILKDIDTSSFGDMVAATSMNRPGPLKQGMPEQYAHNKFNIDDAMDSPFYDYTEETYGTLVYQEQIQKLCVNIGGMSWADADKVMKMVGKQSESEDAKIAFDNTKNELKKKFVKGAIKNGFDKDESKEMFESMLVYSFNKGHATGYTLISVEEMYYKVYYPTEFWFIKIKYALNDSDRAKLSRLAVAEDCVIFLPHVNYTAQTSFREQDGDPVIQLGLDTIKDVGEKAAAAIQKEREVNGIFKNKDDFIDRMDGRSVNVRTIRRLTEDGALEFNHKTYVKRVTKYNSALYSSSVK